MQKVIGDSQSAPANIEVRLQELDSKMNSLDREVGRLVELIESRLAGAKVSAADAA